MHLNESVESINEQLRNLFGIDSISSRPIFRVVWSDDQFEKRLTDSTAEGILLLSPIMKEVPKYKQWIQHKFILERLVVVPDVNKDELVDKLSYEPLWIFETQQGDYLPPRIDAAKLIIDTMYAALGKKGLRKYVDEEANNPVETTKARIEKLTEELFGNETSTGDSLAYKTGVTVPHPMKGSEV